MTEERQYLVIPAAIVEEHAIRVPAADRWRAWRAARDADPELERDGGVVAPESSATECEDDLVIPESHVLERPRELWIK